MTDTITPKVISFVDKQLLLTQKRHAELESSLAEMMSAIEDNARLQLNLHDLTLEVMRAHALSDAVTVLCSGLKNRFALRDVQVWGQSGSLLPRPVPTVTMMQFLAHMKLHDIAFGDAKAFPSELWLTPGVVSGCAFRLSGLQSGYGVLVLGRNDLDFSVEADTLFLQQFVAIIGFWLESMGAMPQHTNTSS